MSVIEWPEERGNEAEVRCVVCTLRVVPGSATVGLSEVCVIDEYDAAPGGFACSAHLGRGESSRFLRAWIDASVEDADSVWLVAEGAM